MITQDKFNFTDIGTSPADRLAWIQSCIVVKLGICVI